MNNVKAIKEIHGRCLLHHCLQVAVGGSNDAIINFYGLMAANPFKFPFLQNA